MYSSPEPPAYFNRPIQVLRFATVVLMMVLLYGFWRTQIMSYRKYLNLAEANRRQKRLLYPPRGLIVDRYGRVLADTRFIPMLVWEPARPTNPQRTFRKLAQWMGWGPDLQKRLQTRVRQLSPIYPMPLNWPLGLKEIALLEFYRDEFPMLSVQNRPIRIYPYGPITAPVLGYVGWLSPEDLRQWPQARTWPRDSLVGKSGLERYYETSLHGTAGSTEYMVNHLGQRVAEIVSARRLPVPGRQLVLSLDLDLQQIAYHQLQDVAAAFVALDPRTGAIRAMVSTPTFDPNEFIPFMDETRWQRLVRDQRHPLQNRVTQGLYSPASTFKIVMAVAALLDHWVTPDSRTYCPGYARLFGHTFRCWVPGGHGPVNLHDALVHSCDVYFYHIGARVPIDRIAHFARRFGLGERTGIDWPAENAGLFPTSEWKQRTRKEAWFPGETVSVAIGQGPILVTPLQLANVAAMVWAEGIRYRPYLVAAIQEPEGTLQMRRRPMVAARLAPHAEAWKRVKAALCDVVRFGTGRAARDPNLNICGKTGTVELLSEPEKYSEAIRRKFRHHAWFIGWLDGPGEPMAFALIMEHSGHGGEAAAPRVRAIFRAYMQRIRSTTRRQVVAHIPATRQVARVP